MGYSSGFCLFCCCFLRVGFLWGRGGLFYCVFCFGFVFVLFWGLFGVGFFFLFFFFGWLVGWLVGVFWCVFFLFCFVLFCFVCLFVCFGGFFLLMEKLALPDISYYLSQGRYLFHIKYFAQPEKSHGLTVASCGETVAVGSPAATPATVVCLGILHWYIQILSPFVRKPSSSRLS